MRATHQKLSFYYLLSLYTSSTQSPKTIEHYLVQKAYNKLSFDSPPSCAFCRLDGCPFDLAHIFKHDNIYNQIIKSFQMSSFFPNLSHQIIHMFHLPTQKDIQLVGEKIKSLRGLENLQESGKEASTPKRKLESKLKGEWRVGRWSEQEQLLYRIFCEQNLKFLKDRRLRKGTKIFKCMSKSIKTRTPEQCRSHHLKILRSQHINLNYESYLKFCDNRILDQVFTKITGENECVELLGSSMATRVYRWQNQNRFCFVVDERSVAAYDVPLQ